MPARHRGDGGSALMLMPAAILVVVVLAAITVDSAVVHLARRQLLSAADDAANDAVTYGIDEDRLRAGEGRVLDQRRVRAAVAGSLEADGMLGRLAEPPTVNVGADGSVTVELALEVDYVFAQALPGNHHALVHASATAVGAAR